MFSVRCFIRQVILGHPDSTCLLLTSQPEKENVTRVKCHRVVVTNLECAANSDLDEASACQFLIHGERV